MSKVVTGIGVNYSRLQTDRGLISSETNIACSGKVQVKILCGWGHGLPWIQKGFMTFKLKVLCPKYSQSGKRNRSSKPYLTLPNLA